MSAPCAHEEWELISGTACGLKSSMNEYNKVVAMPIEYTKISPDAAFATEEISGARSR